MDEHVFIQNLFTLNLMKSTNLIYRQITIQSVLKKMPKERIKYNLEKSDTLVSILQEN